jgi:hypothetical protein
MGDVERRRGGDVAGDSVGGGGWVGVVEAEVRSGGVYCPWFVGRFLFVVRADFQSLEALAEAIPVLGKGDESRAPIFYLGIYYSLLTGQPTVYSYVK